MTKKIKMINPREKKISNTTFFLQRIFSLQNSKKKNYPQKKKIDCDKNKKKLLRYLFHNVNFISELFFKSQNKRQKFTDE